MWAEELYVWIWRRLPGGLPGKLIGSLVLMLGMVALLFFFVFPWAENHLPFNNVNVDTNVTPSPTPSSSP